MKKYIVLILSLVLIIACKNTTTDSTKNQDNPAKPVTLAERSGTYKGTSTGYTRPVFITINKDGKGVFITGEGTNAVAPVNITLGDPASTNTSFYFNTGTDLNWTIDFDKNTLQAPEVGFYSALFNIVKQD